MRGLGPLGPLIVVLFVIGFKILAAFLERQQQAGSRKADKGADDDEWESWEPGPADKDDAPGTAAEGGATPLAWDQLREAVTRERQGAPPPVARRAPQAPPPRLPVARRAPPPPPVVRPAPPPSAPAGAAELRSGSAGALAPMARVPVTPQASSAGPAGAQRATVSSKRQPAGTSRPASASLSGQRSAALREGRQVLRESLSAAFAGTKRLTRVTKIRSAVRATVRVNVGDRRVVRQAVVMHEVLARPRAFDV